jgi:uncharacterized protein (DUF1778 family)
MARKPAGPRAVISLSMPIHPDWSRATEAAKAKDETLADFMREAIRQRANRILGRESEQTPTDLAA